MARQPDRPPQKREPPGTRKPRAVGTGGALENAGDRNTARNSRTGAAAQARARRPSQAGAGTVTGDTPLARLRRQRNAQRVHQIGERAVFELIDELVRHHPAIADDIDRRLGQYAGIDRRVLAAVGGDKFAPWPPRIVGGTS